MPQYRFVSVSKGGNVAWTAASRSFANDAEAMRYLADQKSSSVELEAWHQDRLVGRVAAATDKQH